ncbi:MAG: rod shape-determining protein MreC [Nitrospinota bacterium]
MDHLYSRRSKSYFIYKFFFALLAIVLLILLINYAGRTFFQKEVLTLFAPFQRVANFSKDKSVKLFDNYISLVDLNKENQRLKKELEAAKLQQNILIETIKKQERLSAITQSDIGLLGPYEIANVIGKSPSRFEQVLILDKGSNNKISKGMPVISAQGLVGRIILTSKNVSKLLLVTDVRSAIDAISQQSRERLILQGTNSEELDLLYLSVNSSIKVGDFIISSGLGGIFPKGVMIGTIKEIDKLPNSLFKKAKLTPSVEINRLEEAIILKVEKKNFEEQFKDPTVEKNRPQK